MFRGHGNPFVLAGILLTLAGLPGAVSAAGSGKFYCCTDLAGKYVCGDILPQACYGQAYRELGADGRTLREIGPPMTAKQRAQKTTEEEERKKEELLQKEQELKDRALLDTYASLNEIEAMRQRSLDDVRKAISEAETRITEIKTQRKRFEDEAEFYKKKTLPPEIEKGLANTELEIKELESVIETKKKDMATLQEKYDSDRMRFLDLQRRSTTIKSH